MEAATAPLTRRKPAQKRPPLSKPLSIALLDDAQRLVYFVIDVILLAICAVTLAALIFPGFGAILQT